MSSEGIFRKCWKIPSDRVLKLRAKLNSGWSIHTANLFHKTESIPQSELQWIETVIQRAKDLEQMEIERVGRMLCRLENMTKNALGDGKKTCSMCGVAFGLFRGSFVYCHDCGKAVCEKCRVDTVTASFDLCMLCKICSENREVWKKSGGWFYGKFPTMTENCQKECIAQVSRSSPATRAYDTWSHRAPEIVRLQSFEPPEENHNENSQYKDWTSSVPDIVRVQSFQPPEENHKGKSRYKDWTVGSVPEIIHMETFEPLDGNHNEKSQNRDWSSASIPELKSLDDNEVSYVNLESNRKISDKKVVQDFNCLSVQSPTLSSSCPSLTELPELRELQEPHELPEPHRLQRKPSIRRKKKPVRKEIN